MTSSDATMTAITEAVLRGRAGATEAAREALTELWDTVGPQDDPLHRCTLAHYLADLHDDPAVALTWDTRALDAARALSDDCAQQHAPGVEVRGFFPSLHLNLADNYRQLASFEAAQRELDAAWELVHALPDDDYAAGIRTGSTKWKLRSAPRQRLAAPRPHRRP